MIGLLASAARSAGDGYGDVGQRSEGRLRLSM